MAPESMTDHAYEAIRQMLVRLELAPGELLNQEALQARIGVGRTPVHQALQRLEAEEFVVVMPRRGVMVTNVDVLELPVLYESRALLEPYMAGVAASRGTSDDWDEMAQVLSAARAVETVEERVSADRRCHEIIWAASGNRFLSRTLDMLYAQSDRLWHMYLIDVTDMQQSLEEHEQLLEVLRSGNGEEASTVMARHIRELHDQINAVIAESILAASA